MSIPSHPHFVKNKSRIGVLSVWFLVPVTAWELVRNINSQTPPQINLSETLRLRLSTPLPQSSRWPWRQLRGLWRALTEQHSFSSAVKAAHSHLNLLSKQHLLPLRPDLKHHWNACAVGSKPIILGKTPKPAAFNHTTTFHIMPFPHTLLRSKRFKSVLEEPKPEHVLRDWLPSKREKGSPQYRFHRNISWLWRKSIWRLL